MKIKESKLFPYPVLRENNDDYINSEFEAIVSHENLIHSYSIGINITLKNPQIIELIKNGEAKIICHLECSKTKYREVQHLKIGENKFTIQAGLLEGVLVVLPLIVASKQINNYFSTFFNKDYEKNSFNIEKGNILAIGKHFTIIIENERTNLSNLPSIFLIRESNLSLDKKIAVVLNNEKIEVYVPKEVYKIYQKYRKTLFYSQIMNSIIILPSLIYTLDQLKDISNNSIEFGDKRWYKVVNKKLKGEGVNLEMGDLDQRNTFELAQKILEYLSAVSMESLIKLEEVGKGKNEYSILEG